MRVLLLGASGFLGSHIAEVLAADPDIHLVRQARAGAALKDGQWVAVDLATAPRAEIASLLVSVRPDVIVNAAGAAIGTDDELTMANVVIVRTLLAGLAEGEIGPAPRIVQLGSAAEYGPTPHGTPISEATVPHPISAYGRSKLAATRLILDAVDRGELAGIVLRIFNPVGRRLSAESLLGAAARRMHAALGQGSNEIALGPLDDYRDFVDARDVADAVRAALAAPPDVRRGAIVNIGRGVALQAREAVALLAAAAAFTGRIVETRPGSARSRGVAWQAADISLARASLGWEPHRSLEEAMRALWADLAST